MDAITQCPACGTLFRVLEEQLQISKGWVRCGQCHEVFDAQLSMVQADATLAGQHEDLAREQAPTPTAAPAAESSLPELPPPLAEQSESGFAVDTSSLAEPQPSPATPISQIGFTEAADHPAREPPTRQDESQTSDLLGEPVSFLSATQVAPAASRRWIWWSLLVVATAAVCAQAVWHWRSSIAAFWPVSAPPLARACEYLGCDIELPQMPELLQVEGVSVKPVGIGAYRVSLVIKSSAPVTVASPALELSLQDSNDSPTLKRVIAAAELGLPAEGLLPFSERAITVFVSVHASTSTPTRVAGYRVLAFYP